MKTFTHLLCTALFLLVCVNGIAAQELADAGNEIEFISNSDENKATPSGVLISPMQVGQFVAANLKYPENTKKQGVEGQVLVRITIAETGRVEAVQIVQGLETSCDEAVKILFMNAPGFVPFVEDGVAITKSMLVPVNFRLR